MRPTIVIADDHVLVSAGFEEIISGFNEYDILYTVENGQQLIEKFAQEKNIPNILLLDISMPVMDGFATAAWLKLNYPAVKVIILTTESDGQSLLKLVKLDVAGFLIKTIHPSELQRAIATIAETGSYFSQPVFKLLRETLAHQDKIADQIKILTEREKEVLSYACTEMTYKEMGEKMFCSVRTVESYRDSLFEKLDVRTRVGLAMYAVKNNFCKS